MIRKSGGSDIDSVLDIWLPASIKAHDFVEASFWESQVENMRNIYIPASETYVFENKSKVVGFYSLNENNLAAIFVSPEFQGKGIGKGYAQNNLNNFTKFCLLAQQCNSTEAVCYQK
jgi:putative acetyltransferase